MSEKKQTNNNMLFGVIIVLLIIIAVLAFFVGKNMSGGSANTTVASTDGKDLTITIVDDKRCTTCGTDQIVTQLKQVPFLSAATFTQEDFSDAGVEDFLKKNNISKLPAAIFSSNKVNDGGTMSPYLVALPDGEYSLQLGSTFDPFVKRSDNGFLLIDTSEIQNIKDNGYIQGNPDAQITWIEYSDLQCPFCAKLHRSTTHEDIAAKYGDKVNVVFQDFPLDFHENALPAAEVLECLGAEKGTDAYYALISASYHGAKLASDGVNIDTTESSSQSFLIDEAVKLGADKATLQSCVDANTYEDKIKKEQSQGQTLFGITGTP